MSQPAKHVFSWSQLYNARRSIKEQFPSIWGIPIIKKANDVLKDILHENDKILDIGSCNRNLKKDLERHFNNITYKSMDIDQSTFHDYYNMADIKEEFDAVVMFECIEHLSLEDGFATLTEIRRVLKPDGIIVLSTPNTYHPHRYWECTHKVPFRYDELGGFVKTAGFDTISIHRVYNDPFISRIFRIYVGRWLHQYLCIDFAKSVLLVAKKQA